MIIKKGYSYITDIKERKGVCMYVCMYVREEKVYYEKQHGIGHS